MFAKIDQTGWSNCNEGSQASPQLQSEGNVIYYRITRLVTYYVFNPEHKTMIRKYLFGNKLKVQSEVLMLMQE